ncbi:adhesin [Pantoea phage vB_PagM_AAM22]|nr:adhesin [Pantoea phage vB_PagM_AAM22]
MKKLIIAVSVSLATFSAAATNGDVQKQIDDLRAGLHDVHMNTLQKYSESWGLEDRANIGKLQESKLDKSVFAVDQARQDKALADTVTKQATTDSKQTSDLKSYADKKATSAYTTSVAHTDIKVARADADRKAGDDALQRQITSNLSTQAERDAGQDTHINTVQGAAQSANEKADAGAVRMDGIEKQAAVLDGRVGGVEVRADKTEQDIRDTHVQMDVDRQQRVDGDGMLSGRITQNSSDIVQLYSNGEYAQSRIDAANANIQANHDAIRSTNRVVSQHTEQLANHEQRIQTLEQETNRNFGALRNKIDRNKKDADAGIAGVAAMASIPQVTEYQTFAVGAGVGNRHDQQALAVGFSARAAQNVVIKVSAATDTNSGWTVGAGTSIGW